jgi:cell division protein ZapE
MIRHDEIIRRMKPKLREFARIFERQQHAIPPRFGERVAELAVNGALRFANGIGRANFWELCAKPLGPADFLAIATAVRVLILEDIPQLSASNYNEAKRFVILIDALYEAKTKLICSAADEPERLYIEGSGSFEFERTASRLREMQAADWGQ